jgi:choline dehydrogenase-like flavoprotein
MAFDAIVVGSGPAGTFASYALRGRNVLVLDVGYRAPGTPDLEGNLYALRERKEDLFVPLIGERFEGLRNVYQRPISLKLKAPYTSYIVRDGEKLAPIVSRNFESSLSFAQGGLANAWGAGVFRFNARDLAGFPVTEQELAPYYDELTAHLGVSGRNDDLSEYFGTDPGLLPPIRLSAMAADILARYQRGRARFRKRGITLGLSRLAVLTRPHAGRAAYRYDNQEFFRPYDPAIYNPVYTLDALEARGEVRVARGYLVTAYREQADRVEVFAKNLATGAVERFEAKHLLLAAGTLCTTKIVLESHAAYAQKCPILDNPMSCIPIFRLDRVGEALDRQDSSLAQLNLVYDDPELPGLLQGSLYGASGPLRSDVIFQLPLAISANLAWSKYMSPAMALWMMFYPGVADGANYFRLRESGEMEINYEWCGYGRAEQRLIRAFRSMGYLGARALCQYPPMGSSLHYAGTLPMKAEPGPFETDREGRLAGTRAVYVCDGACFTHLPAKNLTFTIMANAMRIASAIRGGLEK